MAAVCSATTLGAGDGGTPLPAPGSPPPTADQPSASAVRKSPSEQPATFPLSPAVAAVVKMADANVSPEVLKAYIESSPPTAPLAEADIIALKQHNVADEVATLLIKQGAKTRALEVQKKNEAIIRGVAARNAKFGGMDPESYDYFQYYYLQPRAMASAYQRLYPYYGPGALFYGSSPRLGRSPYGYGWPRVLAPRIERCFDGST